MNMLPFLGSSFVLVIALAPALASAQTIQGQIIIQEASPQQTTMAPPPSGYIVAAPAVAPTQPQCPVGSTLMPNRFGQMSCMSQVQRHRVNGGLLGAGIGLLAGGWVLEIVSTLVTTVGGVIGCSVGAGCDWITSGRFNTYSWSGYVPVIGPYIQMATLWNNADPGMYAWLLIEGLLQAGGLTMLIFGALGEDEMVWEPIAGLDVQFAPMLSATTQGMSATARF